MHIKVHKDAFASPSPPLASLTHASCFNKQLVDLSIQHSAHRFLTHIKPSLSESDVTFTVEWLCHLGCTASKGTEDSRKEPCN